MVDDARNHLVKFLFKDVHRSLYRLLRLSRNRLNRLWQCLLVHLLVLVQWYGVDLHRHSRNHIRRLLVEDEIVERLDIDFRVADNISSDELAVTALFIEGLYGSILDTGKFTDHALHLFQLDAEATNLHLSVLATYELDIAVGQIAYDVASAIYTGIFFLISKWIANIHLRRLLRSVQIASAHLWTTDP